MTATLIAVTKPLTVDMVGLATDYPAMFEGLLEDMELVESV